jgi:hypothetical protein
VEGIMTKDANRRKTISEITENRLIRLQELVDRKVVKAVGVHAAAKELGISYVTVGKVVAHGVASAGVLAILREVFGQGRI